MSSVLKTSIDSKELNVKVLVSRLDAAVARDFKAGVDSAWESGVARVNIDLGAVEFIDSSGVGALLSVFRKLTPGEGGTRLTNVTPGVQSVLELLRMHRVFELA